VQIYGMGIQPWGDQEIVIVGVTGGNFFVTRLTKNGSLDSTFAGGTVTTDFGTTTDIAYAVAFQQWNQKIVVAGTTGSNAADFALLRYKSTGLIDSGAGGFNSGAGYTLTDIASGSQDEAYGIGIQSDGKIVVAGLSDADIGIVRYNATGSLDTSFNANGKLKS